jgi:hypothetical protein
MKEAIMIRFGLALLVVAALAVLPGCGSGQNLPEMGEVTGTITYDGNPLAGASVGFEPQGGGGPSSCTTDASGKYELMYTRDVKGAVVGKHVVRIEKMADAENMDQEIQIPARYNMESELTADVKAGKNENVDFKLTSQ